MVASLEQLLDLNTTSFEDVIGRLKAYEERIRDDEEEQEDQTKLMYSNMEPQGTQVNSVQPTSYNRDYNRDYRNRGRGGRGYYRGDRGRGRYYAPRDVSRITCYRCDKT